MNENPQGHNTEISTPVAEIAGAGVVPPAAIPQETRSTNGKTDISNGNETSFNPERGGTNEQNTTNEASTDQIQAEDLGYTETIDNPAIQGVANIFKEAGIKSDDAMKFFEKALNSNNISDIDENGIISTLGDKLGTLVISVAKGVFYENNKRAEVTRDKFLQVIGGEDAWGSIRQWVNDKESKDPEFKTLVDGYRELLNKDESSALLVANALKSMYRDANVTRKPSAFVQGDPRAAAIGISPILDITEFGRLYSKARRDNNADEANQILARWRVGGGKNHK